MKKNVFYIGLIGIAVGSILMLNSCNNLNPEPEPEKPDLQSVDDNSDVQATFDDILGIAEDVMGANNSDMDKSGNPPLTLSDTTCATVTLDTAFSLNGVNGRITIDFGETNCTGADGQNRRGKIYVDYTGKYRTTGTVITTTLDNFHVNDHKIEGTKVVEKTDDSTFTVNVTDAKITWTDGSTTMWESTRTRVWTEGRSTLFNLSDDVYTINGTASGTNRTGTNFTATINDVEHKVECWFQKIFVPSSGVIEVTPEGSTNPRSVDYGDGTCDKTVTITVAGIEYEHTFR